VSDHLTVAEIAEASRWPAGDPRHAHLDACVRCRTLLARYASFVADPADVPSADLREAESQLSEYIEREIGGAQARRSATAPRPSLAERLRAWFAGPAWKPAFAMALLLVLGGGALMLAGRIPLGGRVSGVLRGGSATEGEAIHLLPPVTGADGVVALRWTAVVGANRYTVRLYSGELRALGAYGPSAETVLTLAPGSIVGAARGDTLLWRVTALHDEARLAESRLETLRAP
jgi:hypothetical protein